MKRRWDIDERGHGVADARQFLDEARDCSRTWRRTTGSPKIRAFMCEVVTGMLSADTDFGPRGHTVRLRVTNS
jgi:hypothetical protein